MNARDPSAAVPGAPWSVVCDFDGTISLEDVTDGLLLRFARPGWQELEAAWAAGRIGARACMAGQIALLDCSSDELAAHLATVVVDPAFARFVAAVRAAGAPLTIASDGLDVVIAALLEREGMATLPVRASRLVQVGTREWKLEFPHARADCASGNATCKCACLAEQPSRATLLVGDGASDRCAAAHADLTFAKPGLRGHCIEIGARHRAIDDFADALCAWRELTAGATAAAVPIGLGDGP